MKPNRGRKFERFLSTNELTRLGTVLQRHREGDDASRATVASAVLLLILTGCRRSEILSLQWQDIRDARIRLRHSKTGPRVVWLGKEARAVIDALPRHPRLSYLFWNWRFRRPFKQIDHYWTQFCNEADLSDVRVHDLRHTFASHATMNGETMPTVGRLLGHAEISSTARYSHLADEHLLDAVEIIGNGIDDRSDLESN